MTDSTGATYSYPYMFPALTSGVVTGTYDSSTRVVTKSGTPFSTAENYIWSVHVFDAQGTKIYGSESIAGSVNTFTIPATVWIPAKPIRQRLWPVPLIASIAILLGPLKV